LEFFFFGAREINPLVAGLVSSNLPAFVAIKLAVTACAAAVFVLAEKPFWAARIRTTVHSKSRTIPCGFLRQYTPVPFLGLVNNIIVIVNTLL
jgi:hypothetical protein